VQEQLAQRAGEPAVEAGELVPCVARQVANRRVRRQDPLPARGAETAGQFSAAVQARVGGGFGRQAEKDTAVTRRLVRFG
jgi:hypothetical protein